MCAQNTRRGRRGQGRRDVSKEIKASYVLNHGLCKTVVKKKDLSQDLSISFKTKKQKYLPYRKSATIPAYIREHGQSQSFTSGMLV